MKLSPASEKFVLHWGEMGARWGVNRTQGQIHALLYLSPQPVHADEIAETLGIARSNVSMGLKELLTWDLIQVTNTLGDRRDFFTAPHDPWEVVQIVVEGRKRREIDPTVALLRECAVALQKDTETPPEVRDRIVFTWMQRHRAASGNRRRIFQRRAPVGDVGIGGL